MLERVRSRGGNVRIGGEVERGVELLCGHTRGLVPGVGEELSCSPNTVIGASDFPP